MNLENDEGDKVKSPSSRTASPKVQKPDKAKKRLINKTFFGCDTCRSRRKKCDLGKPGCVNCQKINQECPGYGITLFWLSSPKFTKSGELVASSVAFKKSNKLTNADAGPDAKRRLIDFVKWEKGSGNDPYETYDDLEQDILFLDNSKSDENVEKMGKTKLLGPFGVFQNSSRSISGRYPSRKIKPVGSSNPIQVPNKSMSVERDVLNSKDEISNEHLWLSNELRDDALLTAAALNGDSHLLDFMNISPSAVLSNNNLDPMNNTTAQGNPPYVNNNITNPNDFLNLLFHKNHNPTTLASDASTPSSMNGNSHQPTGSHHHTPDLPMNKVIQQENDILIDPTNQHLYYSNYNNYFYDNPYKLNENLEIHLHASSKPNKLNEESTDLVEGDHQHVTKMPSSIMSIVQSPLQPKLGFNPITPSFSAGLPTTALQIQPLTRYLLNHYVTHVADLMTVLPLTESPWKTIYFPRALMAIGELGALGKTSTAKNALLNALLAVSAFNLQSKFPKNSDSMKFYLNLGIRLRNQASLFIKELLGSSSDTQLEIETCLKNEKYKDVLCAVMSMISVDLVWGTMQDTNFYIRWCGKVINTKMQTKKNLSSKARILHRIFLSLKIIQDSTCLNIENIRYDYKLINEQGYDINGENFIKPQNSLDKNNIKYIVNNTKDSNPTPLFINKKLINTKNHNENFATDALYGLPNSLIKLFASTVQLIRRKIYNEYHKSISEDFEHQVGQLDEKLESWELDWKLYEVVNSEKKFYSPMHEVTFHHILSFYYGLVIYFGRLIKGVNPSVLQGKVKMALDHLNSIQRLISKEKVGIIPLFWQGFIAGCEAISPELQMGYKKWGADIAQYLGSYWGARQIMLEVWRRKRLNLAKDEWVGVINDWEMNLMLN